MLTEWALLAGLAAVTGTLGGVLSGLLGVGGGIIIVPVLEAVLGVLGVDVSVRMPLAVATSLATIIPTSIASSRAHMKQGAVDFVLVRRWAPAVIIGAALGSVLASRIHTAALSALFAAVAAGVAIKMLLPLESRTLSDEPPSGAFFWVVPAAIGLVSCMMGIGGGTLSVPTLTLMNQPVHRAVGTASLLGLAISVPGTIGYLLATPTHALLPVGTIGLVNLTAFALITPTTVLAAPLGARIAHALSRRELSATFGVFLAIVAARMLYRALA